jgi:peptidoglycan/xylan/chitin deacetylase (PgdA/CDA1 family)
LAGLWVKEYPKASARIAANPNLDVASHSYLHASFSGSCFGLPVLDPSQYEADIKQSEAVIRALKPVHMTNFFRFPGGCYTRDAVKAAKAAGVQAVQWSVASGDVGQTDPDPIVENVVNTAKNGSIVIMHLTKQNAPATGKAISAIVSSLCTKQFKCVRLSELLASGNVAYARPTGP